MIFLIIATFILILNWVIEYARHCRNMNAIPYRIHVNGTRGKSSVTRLIAAGLRAGGVRCVAKTTGTMPRFIHPDGTESAIVRLMGANIIEQKYMFRNAVSMKPQAIIIECMAVNPVYQWVAEHRLVKATCGVLTNARLDHTDQMGETVPSIAKSLANFFPHDKVCFTAENVDNIYNVLKERADYKNTDLRQILPHDVTPEELNAFSYIEHADNIQLALAVCTYHGVARDVALKGMQSAIPDPGALTQHKVKDGNKNVMFYNVFAANDPNSTEFLYHRITDNLKNETKIVILNGRSDRFYRTEQLLEVCSRINMDYVFLTGESTEKARNSGISLGIPKEKLLAIGEPKVEEVYKKVLSVTGKEAHIIGIGNIAGQRKYGAQIVDYFKLMEKQTK